MAGLETLLQETMRRRRLTAQAIADRTGIRTPRIRVWAQDGADGPIRPTLDELTELARALALPPAQVLRAAGFTAALPPHS